MRLAFLNVQSGVGVTRGYWQYALRAHRYFWPHDPRIVGDLAAFIARERLVVLACAEMERRSFRSANVDYVEALAAATPLKNHAFFPTQKLGGIVNQGNSVHSSDPILLSAAHRLPGSGEARILGEVQLGGARPLSLFVTHLSLGRRARAAQLFAIAERLRHRPRALLVGDFNTGDESELSPLYAVGLRRLPTGCSHPSWRPSAAIDHALCSEDLTVVGSRVDESVRVADHLPLVIELSSA